MENKYVPIENLQEVNWQPKFAIFCKNPNSIVKNTKTDLLITKKITEEEINEAFIKIKELYFNESKRLGGHCTMWERLYIAVLI